MRSDCGCADLQLGGSIDWQDPSALQVSLPGMIFRLAGPLGLEGFSVQDCQLCRIRSLAEYSILQDSQPCGILGLPGFSVHRESLFGRILGLANCHVSRILGLGRFSVCQDSWSAGILSLTVSRPVGIFGLSGSLVCQDSRTLRLLTCHDSWSGDPLLTQRAWPGKISVVAGFVTLAGFANLA